LRARPWDTISLRVFLQPAARAGERAVDLLRPVPRRVGEGSLRIRGGRAFDGCFFCGAGDAGEGPGGADSFEELLAKLAGAEHNSDLVAELNVRRTTRRTIAGQPEIILGRKSISVVVVR
jgi:hypothetical protein